MPLYIYCLTQGFAWGWSRWAASAVLLPNLSLKLDRYAYVFVQVYV